ncbi:MAG: serine/threonine protein kinase [Planctomyces sp.]|nr:serine/threonine protein kinase [Planctomyces sp.]
MEHENAPGKAVEAGDEPESSLFQLLDAHVEMLHTGQSGAATVSLGELTLERSARFRNLLSCLNDLERLAPGGPAVGVIQPAAPTTQPTLRRIGPYEILGEIGRGGMGVVYRARHTTLHCERALKVIRASDLATSEEVRRFQQEARAAAALSHPGIIRVYDVGEHDGLHYLTMDLVDGQNLAQRLRGGPLTPEQAALLMASVARAVQHLHSRNIVHRDLKPSNILLDPDGQAFISDFGLAKVFAADAERTVSGTIIGTPDYMSPEQAAGHSAATTTRSDVFSLGAILYEMLTGQQPFHGEHPLDTLLHVLEGEPTLPRKLNRRIPSDLEQICLRCLEKDPDRRYPTAAALADDLQRFADQEPIALPSVSFRHRLRRMIRREPALVSHLAAISLAALIVQVRAFVAPVEARSHSIVMGIFAVWALCSWGLQWWMRREAFADAARFLWAALDVVLYTALLSLSESWGWRTDLLVIGYPLMMSGAALWFRVRLIWFMTAVSVISYGVLRVRHPEMHAGLPEHFAWIAAGMLVVIGANLSYQVYRFKLLDRVYHRRTSGDPSRLSGL